MLEWKKKDGQIEKNANELITEEEREKRKVEKRRAKKKVNTFNSI